MIGGNTVAIALDQIESSAITNEMKQAIAVIRKTLTDSESEIIRFVRAVYGTNGGLANESLRAMGIIDDPSI